MLLLHYHGEEEVKLSGVEDEEAGRCGQGDGDDRDGVCDRRRRRRAASR
jgi:hypothetical protein